MTKILFNDNWKFHIETPEDGETEYGFIKSHNADNLASSKYDDSWWESVTLPHDWGISLEKNLFADSSHGAVPISKQDRFDCSNRIVPTITDYPIGWYRKSFFVEENNQNMFVFFDGIYRDAVFWVNGCYIDRHASGYIGTHFDLTPFLLPNCVNSISVRVDASMYEGWWYEGAGMYGNVYIAHIGEIYFLPHETHVRSSIDGNVEVETKLNRKTSSTAIYYEVFDNENRAVLSSKCASNTEKFSFMIENPKLWDIENPNLYTLKLTVQHENEVLDTETVTFGLREFRFDAEKGFFLNGKNVKLKGVCNHHDFACVGVALTPSLNEYRIKKLKEIGVNAYRTSHNAPSPSLLDACDKHGILVMDETRFCSASPESLRQLRALVKRDRNHACVFLWSIGNEEFAIQSNILGTKIAKAMCEEISKHDNTRQITYAGNNGSDFEGINSIVDVRGVNYLRIIGDMDEYHAKNPTQPMLGSEEGSSLNARGVYKTDKDTGYVNAYDENTMPWGSSAHGWWRYYDKRDYLCGGFIWTGFDYRGEPSPFRGKNVVSNFGIFDLCGFEKDHAYYYKSWWTSETVLHLFPHWNFENGEKVRVCVYTNCERVDLYLNGRLLETQNIEKNGFLDTEVIFEKGELLAKGFIGDKLVKETKKRTTDEPCEIVLTGDKLDDFELVTIRLKDKKGNYVEHIDKTVKLTIASGEIIGVGNGDPLSTAPEQLKKHVESKEVHGFLCDGHEYDVFIDDNELSDVGRQPTYIYLTEEKIENFEDNRRRAWFFRSLEKIEKNFCVNVNNTDGFESMFFERLVGCYKIKVNGNTVIENESFARIPQTHDGGKSEIPLEKGENKIEIEMYSMTGKCGIFGGVYMKKSKAPQYYVKTFSGKALVIINNAKCNEIKASFAE